METFNHCIAQAYDNDFSNKKTNSLLKVIGAVVVDVVVVVVVGVVLVVSGRMNDISISNRLTEIDTIIHEYHSVPKCASSDATEMS